MLSLFKYLKKQDYLLLFISLSLIVLQVWLELIKMPEYTGNLTTIVQSGSATMSEVWHNGALMLLCALGSLVSAIICGIMVSRIASSFSFTLRDKIYSKISSFSDYEMKQFSVPSLITRTTGDVVHMQNFMAMGVQLIFKAPITAVWAIFKISETNTMWTTSVVISVAIIVVTVLILVAICLPRFKRIQKLTDDINNVTRENVEGIRVVRAFNAEDYQKEKFEKVNNKITSNNLITSRAMGLLNPIITIVMNGLTLAIYYIASILINDISFDIPTAVIDRIAVVSNTVIFTRYAMQVVMAFMMLIMIFIVLPRTIVSGNRIAEVLRTKPSILDGEKEINDEKVGEVEFKSVSFAYPDSEGKENVLSNISFKLNKGETLAIIGPTGSAKTSLINLISRIYDATSGEVKVDGINVKDYSKKTLRDKISIATQKAVLFKGSIKDNVAFGKEKVDEDRLDKALDIAQAEFVKDKDSRVSQGGTNFSGGQKQRLSIARAIYKDAEIIIFDDTFSALDYKTDMMVRHAIKKNLKDKTIIIVAQRIGTIKDADKILVLDEGKVAGIGKHDDLLKSCPIYKEIALSQLSKEEL